MCRSETVCTSRRTSAMTWGSRKLGNMTYPWSENRSTDSSRGVDVAGMLLVNKREKLVWLIGRRSRRPKITDQLGHRSYHGFQNFPALCRRGKRWLSEHAVVRQF